MWKAVARSYDALIVGLAWFAVAAIVSILVMVVYDVSVRTAGFTPPRFTGGASEYALLYFTLCAGPYLVRKKGHIFVESGRAFMSPRARRQAEVFTYLICILVCLIIATFSTYLLLDTIVRGDDDVRSILIPRWMLFLFFPPACLLMAIEFARFLFGIDSMYAQGVGERDTV